MDILLQQQVYSTLPSSSQHECNFKHLHNIHLIGGFQALFPPCLCQYHLVPSLLLLCHTQTLLSSSFQMRNTQSGVGHKGDKGSEIIHKLFTNSFSELDSSASAELKWGSIPILSREKKNKGFYRLIGKITKNPENIEGMAEWKQGKMDRRGEE